MLQVPDPEAFVHRQQILMPLKSTSELQGANKGETYRTNRAPIPGPGEGHVRPVGD